MTSSATLFKGNMSKPEIFLIEEYPCKNKHQLLARERYHIENNDCVNKIKSILTIEEVYQQMADTEEGTVKYIKN